MKIRNLKNYGIPSYILNIWEKHYSPCLLPIQEEAVKKYGIMNCGENEEGRMQYAPTGGIDSRLRGNDINGSGNDREEGSDEIAALSSKARNDKNQNLLVIAPTSSGKTFIGEMAAVAQVIHLQKTIYLVPLRALTDEKIDTLKISTVIVEWI